MISITFASHSPVAASVPARAIVRGASVTFLPERFRSGWRAERVRDVVYSGLNRERAVPASSRWFWKERESAVPDRSSSETPAPSFQAFWSTVRVPAIGGRAGGGRRGGGQEKKEGEKKEMIVHRCPFPVFPADSVPRHSGEYGDKGVRSGRGDSLTKGREIPIMRGHISQGGAGWTTSRSGRSCPGMSPRSSSSGKSTRSPPGTPRESETPPAGRPSRSWRPSVPGERPESSPM